MISCNQGIYGLQKKCAGAIVSRPALGAVENRSKKNRATWSNMYSYLRPSSRLLRLSVQGHADSPKPHRLTGQRASSECVRTENNSGQWSPFYPGPLARCSRRHTRPARLRPVRLVVQGLNAVPGNYEYPAERLPLVTGLVDTKGEKGGVCLDAFTAEQKGKGDE